MTEQPPIATPFICPECGVPDMVNIDHYEWSADDTEIVVHFSCTDHPEWVFWTRAYRLVPSQVEEVV